MSCDSNSSTKCSQNEILLMQVSLIQMMSSKVHSEVLNEDVRQSYLNAIRILLEDMDILSKLNLSTEGWMRCCLYTLSEEAGSSQAAEWLQTITFVIKELLKGKSLNKTVTIQKFLIPLDSIFDGLYTSIFALNFGWLRQVPVSPKPSFFGGSEILGVEDSNCGPDLVMVRAVSLILIKAMEMKVQNRTLAVKEKGSLRDELHSWVSQLLMFLRMHFQSPAHSQQLSHPCALVSLVFGEQDDDMVEAARGLLTIYARSYRALKSYPQEKADLAREIHEHCFNPHCIFLLMLQSLAFDHCVLLDFLISTETCFLEYLVRYLRLLQEDWQPFCCICVQFDAVESFCLPAINDVCDDLNLTAGVEQDRTNNQTYTEASKEAIVNTSEPHLLTPMGELRNSEDAVSCNNSHLVSSCRPRPRPLGQSHGLVDYESSEDSDTDGVESASMNIISLESSQDNDEVKDAGTSERVKQVSETTERIKVVRNPRDVNSYNCEKDTKMSFEGMFQKSMSCLTELRKTISRLQGRCLFPYNATALLKLLLDIETRSRKDA
ncbi:hypothetical protein scyTo_0018700 [Scyliorhinus torazame]|uniref:Protein Lines N-terminal domain-containing protein n=1 Tax=Scyliorhinus torazame TaxID=75743 RepID=A0A401Q128_SCYTO|nr:hypothetical protein [Scyliorhinus torazame]